jgi:hypothetical protein
MLAKKQSHTPRRCRYCRKRFLPKYRRQIYCGNLDCSRQRRGTYMKRYRVKWKARNANYWKSKRQYEYLRLWRQAHPDYFRRWRRRRRLRARLHRTQE